MVSDEVCVVPTDEANVAPTTDRASVATPRRPGPRIDWATLLHRVWNVDALKCPRCEGAMKFIATITGRAVIVRILTHLRIPTEEMLPAPARRWDDTSRCGRVLHSARSKRADRA